MRVFLPAFGLKAEDEKPRERQLRESAEDGNDGEQIIPERRRDIQHPSNTVEY